MARKTDIRLRRSATAGNKPSTSDLNLGELALNTYDGAVFLKHMMAQVMQLLLRPMQEPYQ